MGTWWEMGLGVGDVPRSSSCVLKAEKQAGDIRSTFYKPRCDSSVEDDGVGPGTSSLAAQSIHEEISEGRVEGAGFQRSLNQSQQFCQFC